MNISTKSDLFSQRDTAVLWICRFCSFFERSHCEWCELAPLVGLCVCSYVCLCECLSCSPGEPQNKPRFLCKEVPVLKAPHVACGPTCVNGTFFQFCSFSCKTPQTGPAGLHSLCVRFVLLLPFRYWPFPLHFSFSPPLPIVRVL